jgi:hypothetical protein
MASGGPCSAPCSNDACYISFIIMIIKTYKLPHSELWNWTGRKTVGIVCHCCFRTAPSTSSRAYRHILCVYVWWCSLSKPIRGKKKKGVRFYDCCSNIYCVKNICKILIQSYRHPACLWRFLKKLRKTLVTKLPSYETTTPPIGIIK